MKQRGFESTTQGPPPTLSFNDVSDQPTPTPTGGGRNSSKQDDEQGIDESDNLIYNK